MKWKTILLLGASILISLLVWVHFEKREAVLLERAEQANKELVKWYKVAQVEKELSEDLSSALKEKHEENNRINSALTDAKRLLNNYRSKSDSEHTSATCTRGSPELYREDGGFLIEEAARGDRIRVERDFYYEQYENARRKLEAYKGTTTR